MENSEAEKILRNFVGRLNFTSHKVLGYDEINDFSIEIIKTKCNGFFLPKFGDELFRLMDQVDQSFFEVLRNRYFTNGQFSGIITPPHGIEMLDAQTYENVDIYEEKDMRQEPSVFTEVIQKVLGVKKETHNVQQPRLKWKASARKLGLIVSILSDLNLIDTPKKGNEINNQELANRTLASFEVKSSLQNMRKSVDSYSNKMGKQEKDELNTQIYETFKRLEKELNL